MVSLAAGAAGAAKDRVWERMARWGAAVRMERSNACLDNMVGVELMAMTEPRIVLAKLRFRGLRFDVRQF